MFKYFFILIVIVCCMFSPVKAQYYHFQNYTVEEGLPQSQVNVIFQDIRGNLWIGTNGGGLCRFTGDGFETYTRRDGLLSDVILERKDNLQGELVIKTILGISIFDGRNFKNYIPADFQFINSHLMHRDTEGNFWFRAQANQNTTEIYKFDGEHFENFSKQYEELANLSNRNNIVIDTEGHLIISSGNEIFEYKDQKLERHPLSDDPLLSDQSIVYFYLDSRQYLWLFGLHQEGDIHVYRYKEKLEKVDFPTQIDASRINAFYEDGEGNIWLSNAEEGELYQWIGGPGGDEVNVFTDQSGLFIAGIRSICHD